MVIVDSKQELRQVLGGLEKNVYLAALLSRLRVCT